MSAENGSRGWAKRPGRSVELALFEDSLVVLRESLEVIEVRAQDITDWDERRAAARDLNRTLSHGLDVLVNLWNTRTE